MRRRLARTIGGASRWVRPARVSFLVLALVIGGCIAGEVALYRWITAAADPATTIVQAGALLRGPVRLASPLDVAWQRTLASANRVDDDWRRLLEPPLPPAICPNPDPANDVGAAITAVDAAIARGAVRDELQRRIGDLRAAAVFQAGTEAEFLVRYNLARGYVAAGDASTADETVEPIFDGFLNGDRLPAANFNAAEGDLLVGGDVEPGARAVEDEDLLLRRVVAPAHLGERAEDDRAVLDLAGFETFRREAMGEAGLHPGHRRGRAIELDRRAESGQGQGANQ